MALYRDHKSYRLVSPSLERRGLMAQFKLRMPEPLRAAIDESVRRSGNSLNTEIVQRLEKSVRQDQQFGDEDLSRLTFSLAARFAVAVQGENWREDPIAYTKGAIAVFDELLRAVPQGPNRNLAIEAIVSGLLTKLAQTRMESKK
jgi:Arc-like DNA binding domain